MEKAIIINIGRQLGSGGHDIGRMLAMDFNANYYDREILNLAAKESGFSAEFFEQSDERHGFFHSLFHMHAPHLSDNNFYQNNFSQESLFKFQSDAIIKAAQESSCRLCVARFPKHGQRLHHRPHGFPHPERGQQAGRPARRGPQAD